MTSEVAPCTLGRVECQRQCQMFCDLDPYCKMYEMDNDYKHCCLEYCDGPECGAGWSEKCDMQDHGWTSFSKRAKLENECWGGTESCTEYARTDKLGDWNPGSATSTTVAVATSSVGGSGSGRGKEENEDGEDEASQYVVLFVACFVFGVCGFLASIAAYIIIEERKAEQETRER